MGDPIQHEGVALVDANQIVVGPEGGFATICAVPDYQGEAVILGTAQSETSPITVVETDATGTVRGWASDAETDTESSANP